MASMTVKAEKASVPHSSEGQTSRQSESVEGIVHFFSQEVLIFLHIFIYKIDVVKVR